MKTSKFIKMHDTDDKVEDRQSAHIAARWLLFQRVLITPPILTGRNLHADSQALNPPSCFTYHLCLIKASRRRVATSPEYSALISSPCILRYMPPSMAKSSIFDGSSVGTSVRKQTIYPSSCSTGNKQPVNNLYGKYPAG